MNVHSISPLIRFLTVLLLVPTFVQADSSAWVELRVTPYGLFVESELSGVSGCAMLDPNVPFNFVNSKFIAQHEPSFLPSDLKVWPQDRLTRDRGERLDVFKHVPVEVFRFKTRLDQLLAFDLGSLETQLSLGPTFLESFVFQFDFPNSKTRAVTRSSLKLGKYTNIDSKKSRDSLSPVVAIVTEDDTVHWALMDFVYSGGLLVDSEFAAHFHSLSTEASPLHLDIRFGPFELERVPIEIDQEGNRVGQPKVVNAINRNWRKRRYTMIVGRDVLKHFLVSVDFQRALVVLEVPDT